MARVDEVVRIVARAPAERREWHQGARRVDARVVPGETGVAQDERRIAWEAWGRRYARIALGAAFLSAVASRFGLWDGTLDLAHFAHFTTYTAKVNAFMPAPAIPYLAWMATLAESLFGIALVAGIRVREAAFGSALLLALFATAMAISFGIKEPMDYSVYSASAGALLLALAEPRRASSNHESAGSESAGGESAGGER